MLKFEKKKENPVLTPGGLNDRLSDRSAGDISLMELTMLLVGWEQEI